MVTNHGTKPTHSWPGIVVVCYETSKQEYAKNSKQYVQISTLLSGSL